MKNEFSPEFLQDIQKRNAQGYESCTDIQFRTDFNKLLAFAEKVIDDIGLDITSAPTYFDADEAETGVSGLDDLGWHMSTPQEIEIVIGYYTKPETYALMQVDKNGKLCSVCKGTCEKCPEKDLTGDDETVCPSDDTALLRVRDIKAGKC